MVDDSFQNQSKCHQQVNATHSLDLPYDAEVLYSWLKQVQNFRPHSYDGNIILIRRYT